MHGGKIPLGIVGLGLDCGEFRHFHAQTKRSCSHAESVAEKVSFYFRSPGGPTRDGASVLAEIRKKVVCQGNSRLGGIERGLNSVGRDGNSARVEHRPNSLQVRQVRSVIFPSHHDIAVLPDRDPEAFGAGVVQGVGRDIDVDRVGLWCEPIVFRQSGRGLRHNGPRTHRPGGSKHNESVSHKDVDRRVLSAATVVKS